MSKILVLYYSMYGHIELMSQAVAEGVRAAGSEATIKRVPETIPEAKAKEIGVKLEQKAPIANPDELGDYDGILFGGPTRYGVMAAQLRNFIDQTGKLWLYGASTISGGDGSRMPSENELGLARFQGQHLARSAAKLAAR